MDCKHCVFLRLHTLCSTRVLPCLWHLKPAALEQWPEPTDSHPADVAADMASLTKSERFKVREGFDTLLGT